MSSGNKEDEMPSENNHDSRLIEQVTKKINNEVVSTNIKLVTSSATEVRANAIFV